MIKIEFLTYNMAGGVKFIVYWSQMDINMFGSYLRSPN